MMRALHDFATWAPILHRVREERPDLREWTGGVGVRAFSLPPPPGPAGHVGQMVVLSHESKIGAFLLADSLTDLGMGQDTAPE